MYSRAAPAQHDDLSRGAPHDVRAHISDVPSFQVRVARVAHAAWTIEIIGCLDLATAPLLDTALALRTVPPHLPLQIELDLQGVASLDAIGLDALHAVAADLETAGAQVTLVGGERQVRRLLQFADEQCWLTATPIGVRAHPA